MERWLWLWLDFSPPHRAFEARVVDEYSGDDFGDGIDAGLVGVDVFCDLVAKTGGCQGSGVVAGRWIEECS